MSRALQYPRHRSSSVTNGAHYNAQPLSVPTTRPQQFALSDSRPTTPVGSSNAYPSKNTPYAPPNTAPLGPFRPQRSEFRNRNDYPTSDHAAAFSQEGSLATSQSDFVGTSYRNYPPTESNTPNGSALTQRDQRLRSPVQDKVDQTSPNSLASALAAFQSAGSRRRQMTENGEDYQYQKERERELQAERVRQQRIREKAPGMRSRNNRAGEIDGARLQNYSFRTLSNN
jgi:exocyst complex component 4